MEDKPKEQIERELALRSHERDWANQDQMFSSAIEYGLNAMRSTNLVCGGAVVVGLAFVGAIYGSQPETARSLLVSVFIFALGAVASASASGFGYLSQSAYAEAAGHKTHQWEHPFVVPTAEHDRLQKVGDRWRRLSTASVVLALISILAGIATAYCALEV